MSSVWTYIIAFMLLTAGLALAAVMLGAPTRWVGIGVIVMIGIAIVSSIARPRNPGPRD